METADRVVGSLLGLALGDALGAPFEFLRSRNVPNPLPAQGAKVNVTGTYSSTFTQSSTGAEADPFMGLMGYLEYQVLEPAAELATLPGIKRKEP